MPAMIDDLTKMRDVSRHILTESKEKNVSDQEKVENQKCVVEDKRLEKMVFAPFG